MTIKRKVRRLSKRPRMSGNGRWAPIYGQDMRVLWHFVPVGDEHFPFVDLRNSYLRTFVAF